MGRLIAVLALAGAAAFAARPSSNAHSHAPAPVTVHVAVAHAEAATLQQAEKDLARRQAELGLVGSAPLFGAEGLPKPATR